MATITRIGYGQVEPNHLSAQVTGQIYAQLPADSALTNLENGRFVKYDYKTGKVNLSGDGEWMLVFNEVKLYEGLKDHYKDFALIPGNFTDGVMVPRVFKTNIGDIYTTNCLEAANTSATGSVVGTEDLAVGNTVAPNAQGYLTKAAAAAAEDGAMLWQIVKIYTLADGQAAVKLMRIA